MDKQRVMPILAGAVVAVSLTACQGMMGGKESSQQTSNAPAVAPGPASQQAMSSDLVRDVQRGLSSRGYDVGSQDGVYGASTEHALRNFQRDQHINPSGQVDAQSLAALGVVGGASATSQHAYTPSPAYTPTSKRGAMASHSGAPKVALNQDQVRSVQQNLTDRGYDPGNVDGRWGPRTQTALRDFQRDQNIQANGRPSSQTLAALGVETGSPSTQTGQLPAEKPAPAKAPQRGVNPPAGEPGELPPTGSQAPGAAPEVERAPIAPGGAPDTRTNPPD